jgi:hypothetical protein
MTTLEARISALEDARRQASLRGAALDEPTLVSRTCSLFNIADASAPDSREQTRARRVYHLFTLARERAPATIHVPVVHEPVVRVSAPAKPTTGFSAGIEEALERAATRPAEVRPFVDVFALREQELAKELTAVQQPSRRKDYDPYHPFHNR